MDPPRSTTANGNPTDSSTDSPTSERVHPGPPPQADPRSEHQPPSSPAATAAAALSREQAATPGTTSNAKKRKASNAPGSRGVANLTPDQLAKKRANDREAQRAIRERTRNNIETLERRIRELEGQQPYQELQRVVHERDRAIAECEEYRQRLGTIAGLAKGSQQPSLSELAALTAQQSPLPLSDHTPLSQQPQGEAYDSPQAPAYQHQQSQPGSRSPTSTPHARSPTQVDTAGSSHHSSDGSFRRRSAGQDQPSGQSYATPPSNGTSYDHHAAPAAQQHGHHEHGDRLELNFLLDGSSSRSPTRSNPLPDNPYQSPSVGNALPTYARTTLLGPPSCPLDSLLIDFHTSRRKLLHEGATALEAIGPPEPFFASMMDPDIQHLGKCHPLSSLMIDILSKFPDISRRPEKVAVYFIMFLIMQWTVCPCERCYNRLPEWCKPVTEQYERSHVAWADYLPWPTMRRYVCHHPVRFEDFFVPYTTTLSLNWPFPNEYVLLSMPSSDSVAPPNVIMNPVFEHHLRDLRNWSLGSKFRDSFPQLIDHTVSVQDQT